MILADIGLGQLIWTTFFLFILAALVWVFIVVVRDLFRNRELSGWAKAGWLVALILVPLLGSIVYIIVRGLWIGPVVGTVTRRRGRSSPGTSSNANNRGIADSVCELTAHGARGRNELRRYRGQLVDGDQARDWALLGHTVGPSGLSGLSARGRPRGV